MIKVENLVKRYDQIEALKGISFEVKKGEIVGFLGPNGAGKTTCVKIITGYISATSGRVLVDGMDVAENPVQTKEKIGYLPENAPLYYDMTPREFLEFAGRIRGIAPEDLQKRIEEVAAEVGITDRLDQEIGTLSKGYKQRVGLAQALLHDPPILILDEPTTGLDPNQIVEIRELIKNLGKNRTVMLSTHNLYEVMQTCNRIIIIHRGQIVADGTPEEIQQQHGGSNRVYISVVPNGHTPKDVVALLKGIDGVKSVEGPFDVSSNHIRFKIEADDADRVKPEIFKAFAKSGIVLSELTGDRLDLESIFQRLTQN